jgi:hypothetical protein
VARVLGCGIGAMTKVHWIYKSTPSVYRGWLKLGFRWVRRMKRRRAYFDNASLIPITYNYPRIVNNNGNIKGVWQRTREKAKTKGLVP